AIDAVDDDPDHSDDAVIIQRTVDPEADLELTTLTAPESLRAGAQRTWSFRVTNTGPGDATAVTLDLPLPDGIRLVGGCCAIGGLEAGESRVVEVTLAADADRPAGTFTLRPIARGAEPDPDSADARAELTVESTREASLGVRQERVTSKL